MSLVRHALVTMLVTACAPSDPAGGPPGDSDVWLPPNPHTLDDTLRLNHVQLRATHNSYHRRPDPVLHPTHDYEMPTLTAQLTQGGVRGFELDVHLSVEEQVFHVFHLPAIDPETTCLRLTDCLRELRDWSVAHPWHAPLVVWIEPKDDIDTPALGYEPIGDRWAAFEEEVLSVWPRDALITPDDVRADAPDLPTALATRGWPTLGATRGKLLLSMLDSGEHRARYLADAPDLRGRLMFADTDDMADPWAATFKDGSQAEVTERVSRGFLTAANVDAVDASDADNVAERDAWAAAGLHLLATDFPLPVEGRAYVLDLPGGVVAGCNPRAAPPECVAAEVEAPGVGGGP